LAHSAGNRFLGHDFEALLLRNLPLLALLGWGPFLAFDTFALTLWHD